MRSVRPSLLQSPVNALLMSFFTPAGRVRLVRPPSLEVPKAKKRSFRPSPSKSMTDAPDSRHLMPWAEKPGGRV